MDAAYFKESPIEHLAQEYFEQFREYYQRKASHIVEALLPQITQVHQSQGHIYKRILIPFTDGRKRPYDITAELEDAVKTKGKSILLDIERTVSLAIIDEKWKEHLRSMDELKDSVQSASFEQRDPLVIYKVEAYNLFEKLVLEINEEVTSYLAKGTLIFSDGTTLEQARERNHEMARSTQTNRQREDEEATRRRAAAAASQAQSKPQTVRNAEPKIGRNDPCPCGSGKKYKQCHGKGL